MTSRYFVSSILIFALHVAFLLPAAGQSLQERERLNRLSVDHAAQWRVKRAAAESIAVRRGMPIRKEFPDGRLIELQRFENDFPIYFTTQNINAAKTVSSDKLWPDGTGGLSLSGVGITLGLWDGGKVRETHQEFGGRLILGGDGASLLNSHSTHVAGTMIAAGVTATAKGMSYAASLRAYDWNSDVSEMASQAAGGLRVSSHSYGTLVGWTSNYFGDGKWAWSGNPAISAVEDYQFGLYNSDAQGWDNIAFNAPNYLLVKSAGNDRDDYGPTAGATYWVQKSGAWVLDSVAREADGGTDGYDVLSDMAVAKNNLVVAAVNDLTTGYTGASGVVATVFTSYGPTDDGRIKPDIAANGASLYSSDATGDNLYTTKSGTSMAAPSVAGSLGLLLQHQKNLYADVPLRSSTLKAIVLHTADEAGSFAGPDYKFGWGLMNTLKAAQLMTANSVAGGAFNIREATLAQGGSVEFQVEATGTQPLRATICWTDPAGTPPATSLNPTAKMLKNDLDLRLVGPAATPYYPWILNPALPANAATTGDNNTDNVEQVYIPSPSPGLYTVRVAHKGSLLPGGAQVVSIVVSGATAPATSAPGTPTLSSPSDGTTGLSTTPLLSWTPVVSASTYQVQVSTLSDFSIVTFDTVGVVTITIISKSLSPNTTHFWRVRAANSIGPSAYSAVWSFTTANPPPAAPLLDSPADGAINISTSPLLVWSGSTGADFYQLQISTSSNFSTTVFNQSAIPGTSATATGLAGTTTHYWRVSASYTGGSSAWSSVRSFTTIGASPSVPTLSYPDSGLIDVPTSISFNWNPANSAASYRLQVATDPSFASGLFINDSSLTQPTKSASNLLASTQYYWRVNAKNSSGTSGFSNIWIFSTVPPVPSSPTLVAPAVNATLVTDSPVLQWNRVESATSYRLQISTVNNFHKIVFDQSDIVDTSYTAGGLGADTYYWHVGASNTGGDGSFSSSRKFSLSAPTDVNSRDGALPTTFGLRQNYPNPFNPSTVIAYQLPTAGVVRLSVYSLLGVEVERLVDGSKPAGFYSVLFDASRLKSGVYFARCTFTSGSVENFILVARMVLTK